MELTRSGKIGDNTVRGEAARGAYNTREEASLVVSLSLSRARVSTDNGVFDRAMSGVPTGFDIRARTDTPIERCYTRESYRKPVLAIALHARARLAREYLSARAIESFFEIRRGSSFVVCLRIEDAWRKKKNSIPWV